MLYQFPLIQNHKAFRLNRNLIYFFSALKKVTDASTFDQVCDAFDSDFKAFLSKAKQATLKGHFENFFNKFKALSAANKALVIQAFLASQKINVILSDNTFNGNLIRKSNLPTRIRKPATDLINYLFKYTLSSYGRLPDHYKQIYESLESNLCPFCGIETLNDPTILKQDYDHMLLISQYVFSGINMNNLVPTGIECNRVNKHNVDVLYNAATRVAFNSPYTNSFNISISLAGSPIPHTPTQTEDWVITINPNTPLTIEWERVYNIKQRYKRNVLKKFYVLWLKEIKTYLGNDKKLPISQNDLVTTLTNFANTCRANVTSNSKNIVKGALYEFVAAHPDPKYMSAILSYVNN